MVTSSSSTLCDPSWALVFHDDFLPEFRSFDPDVQDGLLAAASAVERTGPLAGRPHVDRLHGSAHANMKELRFSAKGGGEVWRAAFAFDPRRCACVLVAGAKQGKSESLFYRQLIRVADARFDRHLAEIDSPPTLTSTRS